MKRLGGHPHKALSAVRVSTLTSPGRYGVGNGLYLVVDRSGAKRWVLRTVVHGRRRDIGLGGTRLVSLSEAREKASEFRKLAREGGNPLEARRKASDSIPTFADAAKRAFAQHRGAWRNEKHAAQWLSTLSTYAFPTIGEVRVDRIDTPDILKVLSPIWLSKAETARRVRQRIGTVLDWSKAAGYRSGDNPASGVSKGLPKQPDRKRHFQALPYAEVPAFVAELQSANASEIACLAFEFLVLTATRTNETLKATWDEVDVEQGLWTIPATRMKAGRPHRVPLGSRCIEILRRAGAIGCGSKFVFPGRMNRPLSNMVFLMIIRRMEKDITAHGFRSAFRDWAAERTNYPREICEMALAHTITNRTEAAYRRGDLFEKRRDLMQQWCDFASPRVHPHSRLDNEKAATPTIQ